MVGNLGILANVYIQDYGIETLVHVFACQHVFDVLSDRRGEGQGRAGSGLRPSADHHSKGRRSSLITRGKITRFLLPVCPGDGDSPVSAALGEVCVGGVLGRTWEGKHENFI